MKYYLVLFFLLSVSIFLSQKQDTVLISKMNRWDFESAINRSKCIFTDTKVSGPGTLSFFPKKQYFTYKYDYINNVKTIIDTIPYYDRGLMISIVALSIEPRFNVKSDYNYSCFFKVPLELGVSLTVPVHSVGYPSVGVFNANTGLLFGYGRNLNSSKINSKFNGYALSIGTLFIYGPMIGGEKDTTHYEYNYNYVQRRSKLLPIVQFDYYWLNKKKKVKGISSTFCPTPFYIKLAYTFSSKIKNF